MAKAPAAEQTPNEASLGFLASMDKYWFGFGSPVSLGVFRILMGGLAFLNGLFILPFWGDWFGEKGYFPAWIGQLWLNPYFYANGGGPQIPRLNLLNGVTDPRITFPFYLVTMVAALLTSLGLWTRVSSVVFAIGLVSLHHRNAAMLHGGDTLMRVMALYIAISPCGAACSLDRLIRLWRGEESGSPRLISLWPQRLISYNLALVYFTTVWLKWDGTMWRDGSATYYPARLGEFYRFPVPQFFREFPMVTITTYGTLFTEFCLATLVFYRPVRRYVVIAGICMHLYIDYSMNIPLFSYLMLATYVAYYDGEEFTEGARNLGRRLSRYRISLHLPAGRVLRPGASEFLRAIDPLGLVSITSGAKDVWAAETDSGRTLPAGSAWTRFIALWPIAWIPGVWRRLIASVLEPA